MEALQQLVREIDQVQTVICDESNLDSVDHDESRYSFKEDSILSDKMLSEGTDSILSKTPKPVRYKARRFVVPSSPINKVLNNSEKELSHIISSIDKRKQFNKKVSSSLSQI